MLVRKSKRMVVADKAINTEMTERMCDDECLQNVP